MTICKGVCTKDWIMIHAGTFISGMRNAPEAYVKFLVPMQLRKHLRRVNVYNAVSKCSTTYTDKCMYTRIVHWKITLLRT